VSKVASEAGRGRVHSEETKQKMRESALRRAEAKRKQVNPDIQDDTLMQFSLFSDLDDGK
jgi:hypothetical protein